MNMPAATVAQELRVHEIQFLGEQDGPPERMLKEQLSAVFVFHR